MERIEGQRSDYSQLARQDLTWIVLAKRPLTTDELLHALAVEEGDSSPDEDNIPDFEDIISVCPAGCDRKIGQHRAFGTLHYSAVLEPQDHDIVSRRPTTALHGVPYIYFFHEIPETTVYAYQCNPPTHVAHDTHAQLYYYAARCWADHVPLCGMEEDPFVFDFLKSVAISTMLYQIHDGSSIAPSNMALPRFPSSNPLVTCRNGLHEAIAFGLVQSARKVLRSLESSVDIKDGEDRTFLWYAVRSNNESMVQMLLGEGANPNTATPECNFQSLWLAAYFGMDIIVQTLLASGPDVSVVEIGERHCTLVPTRLQVPIDRQKKTTIKRILPHETADLNFPGSILSYAMLYHTPEFVKRMLADVGATLDTNDREFPQVLNRVLVYEPESWLLPILTQKKRHGECMIQSKKLFIR